MHSSPEHDNFLMSRPSKISTKGNFFSKIFTWLAYYISVFKKPISITLVSIVAIIALSVSFSSYMEYREVRAKEVKVQNEILLIQNQKNEIQSLVKDWETKKILAPMSDKDIDELQKFVTESYLDSIKDLSRAYFGMQYISKEGNFNVVLEGTMKEMTDIIENLNKEYVKTIKFMNVYRNSVRTYDQSIKSENVAVLNLTKEKMKKDVEIYTTWYNWKVSGEYRKTELINERADRHLKSVSSFDKLNEYLSSKSQNIERLEPFGSLVIKR